MIARDTTIDDHVEEARQHARFVARLAQATPMLRAIRAAYGWGAAIARMLEDFDGVPTQDVAAVFGVSVTAAHVACERTGFAELHRARWSIVDNPALRELREELSRDTEERTHAGRDRHLVNPWRRGDGKIKTTKYADAVRALFADGRIRSSREVAYVVAGAEADSGHVFTARAALSRCEEVERAGDDTWRRIPTRDELRARISELEAEVAMLRSGAEARR